MGMRHEGVTPEHDETIREIAAILVQGYLRYRKGIRPFRVVEDRPEEVVSTPETGVDSTGPESVHVAED